MNGQVRMQWLSEDGSQRFTAVYDMDYEVEGSFALDTEEQTKAAERDTLARLASGEWIVIGITVAHHCPNTGKCCHSCDGWQDGDSLWGIVIEDNDEQIRTFASECF